MKFETIKITGGQADTVDPRTTPGSVPQTHIKEVPQALTGTDRGPTNLLLTLEGTAAQTVTVQQFVLDESQTKTEQQDDPKALDAQRKFYTFGATQVVTVGTVVSVTAAPGKVYYRLTAAPAADATLKIGWS